jgi:hypothetical protein
MANQLQGKVAVITGGTNGIGLATAKRFVAEGAHVYITGRRHAELEAAVSSIGGNATGVRCDVSKLPDLDGLFETVKAQKGRIDVLFTNAGGGELAPLGTITEEHYQKTFDTNVKGTLFTVQKALPLLRDGASVILMSSTAGISGNSSFSVYGATKAAVRNFARNWMLDLKDRKIRVNAISPGPIQTPGWDGLFPPAQLAEIKRNVVASIPSGRMGDPDEVAKAVVFLGSDAASFVNGAELFVDGGAAQI